MYVYCCISVKVNGQEPKTVTSFQYLGSVITDEGSKPEILSRIDKSRTDKAEPVWNDRNISLNSRNA